MPSSLPIAACLLALALPAQWGCNSSEPTTARALDPRPFEAMARQSDCADRKNRLFLIDGSFVFWDKAGSCADAAFSQTLFGATPEELLCRYGDSIAGPVKECRNPLFGRLFEIILAHPDQPDLGLGPGHTVRPIPF